MEDRKGNERQSSSLFARAQRSALERALPSGVTELRIPAAHYACCFTPAASATAGATGCAQRDAMRRCLTLSHAGRNAP